jgi:hypothetical protein
MHLIQKHSVHVNCLSKQLGHQFKDELGAVLRQEFYPKLEKLLDQYDVANQVQKISNLPVHIALDNPKNWKTTIVQQSLEQITSFLQSQQFRNSVIIGGEVIKEHKEVVTKTRSGHLQELFLDYLKKGVIPSNSMVQSLKELFEELTVDTRFTKRLIQVLSEKNITLLRWFLNVPEQLKTAVIATDLFPVDKLEVKTEIRNVMQAPYFQEIHDALGVNSNCKLEEFVTFLYWNYILKPEKQQVLQAKTSYELKTIAQEYFGIPLSFFDTVKSKFSNQNLNTKNSFTHYVFAVSEQLVAAINSQGPLQSVFKAFNDLQREKGIVKENTVKIADLLYIKNAGLALLHPFLFPLFQKLGFLNERKWKSKQWQHRAVLITQYLVRFENTIDESDLLFNKLLCGVPQTTPIATDWTINPEEEQQCRSLLESVIEHWKILKNTSPEGLQHSFIQREGKLSKQKNGSYQLVVSQIGVDVLLHQLPWGLGMFKTEWMEHFIDCIWN